MGDESPVLVAWEGAVVVVTLNRPERLNALSRELLVALRDTLRDLDAAPAARAIVLTGAGRAFSSGADLRAGPSDAEQVLRTYYNPLVLDMQNMQLPLIAAVNGVAVGAAVGLALACDLRVAASGASFLLPFTKIGLVPDAGTTWLLPRAIGSARAAEMALAGREVEPAEAHEWGLVNGVAPDGDAVKHAVELAGRIAGLSNSVTATRRLLNQAWDRDLAAQLDAEATEQGLAQHHPDYVEARQAFVEMRAARFGARRPSRCLN